ncbi:TonB-dependent receptor domain-containing protein [Blastomonas sp.]|uniref:TonB-dependent receptor domain-containing protein n=1 Tax=Blastomonas sp. TaxID=1909299 RepID=UPI00391D4470
MATTPVFAQDQETQEEAAASSEVAATAIVVTGSRIERPNLSSPSPVTSITIADLPSGGDVSLGDALNELPALRSTFSQSNSTRFIGTAGLNLLDLRGLGTNRTLVVVNGRRHITSQPGVPTSVDINTIPTDLVERVDIGTGGNAAVYGADAVAGVVNFILKRDFEGITLRTQGGISSQKDRGSYFASLTAGQNFSEGRGNVAVNMEYSFQNDLYYTDRDRQYGAFSGRNQFQLTENTIGEPAAGNGIPDNTFLRGIRNITISEGGLYTSACPAASAATAARRALNCNGLLGNTGQALGYTFVFMPDGTLARNEPTQDFRTVGSGNSQGGLGSTLRLTGQLNPQLERIAVNSLARYEFSEAFGVFLESKYVRINAIQEGQPTFFNNTFSINNPFLTAQARDTLVQSLAPGATTFTAQRFNVDFGGRGEDHQRETFRIVGGIEGTFNNDWKYEVALNYGRLETFYRTEGNLHRTRYANSINAVRNAAGQIVCGINADASTANDDPSCVPVNLFGNGQPSQAALNYFIVDSTRQQNAEQINATAFVSGNLGQLFELPGGPISFAIGGEHRNESAFSAFDAQTRSGVTFLNAIPVFDPPRLKSYEGFGEIRIPILADMPFFHELSLEGAGRIADYNIGNSGTIYTYNVSGVWAPVPDLRIRGSYARSVRIPTQTDLFAEPSQTFLNGLVDPCSQNNINNNPNRVRNCAAAGVPVTEVVGGVTVPFTNVPASGIRGLNGSNANLSEERSTSYTAGFVAQPRFIPGLTLSVDYYNITIDNVIFSLGAQTIINQCYDNPSGINNPFCDAVFRRPDGTFRGQENRVVGGGTVSYPVAPTDASFLSGPFNFAKQKTSGIDADISYTVTDGSTRLNLRGVVSYVIRRDNFTDINDPSFRDQVLFELGDPRWAGTFSADLDFGAFDIGYRMRYIDKQSIGTIESVRTIQGRPPTNPDQFPRDFYPRVVYHNIRAGVDIDNRFRFYGGIDNLTDRQPPLGLDGTTVGSGTFDNVGRFFYVGAEAKF